MRDKSAAEELKNIYRKNPRRKEMKRHEGK